MTTDSDPAAEPQMNASQTPVRVGVAVIVRGSEVLIDRRAAGPLAGWWEFPGGKALGEETIPDCIRRECREELAVEVAVGERLRLRTFEYPHGLVELHFHLCSLAGGEPRAVEVAELAWVSPQEAGRYRMLEANAPVLEDLVRMFGAAG